MNMYSSFLGVVALSFIATTVQAAPVIYNDAIPAGTAAFDATVLGAGGTVTVDSLSSLVDNAATWARTGYEIRSTDGSNRSVNTSYLTSGDAITIDPYSPFPDSGLTFNFTTPINAFGLEVGDWATCCHPSSLYISFNGGATRLVATANSDSDNPGVGDGYRNFVGAIDTSNTFSTVTFYGDGLGEVLYGGGTIRFATLNIGSVPEVPEPETYAMMLAGLGLIGFSARRKKQA